MAPKKRPAAAAAASGSRSGLPLLRRPAAAGGERRPVLKRPAVVAKSAASCARPCELQDWMHRPLASLLERLRGYMKREAELHMEMSPDDLEVTDLLDSCWASRACSLYDARFVLVRHPETGIFHAFNLVTVHAEALPRGNGEAMRVDVQVDMIGGNIHHWWETAPENECMLHLAFRDAIETEKRIVVTSSFWPTQGVIVDGDGKFVSLEAQGETKDWNLEVSEMENRPWEFQPNLADDHPSLDCGCSAFVLDDGKKAPHLTGVGCSEVRISSCDPYRQIYIAIWCLQNLKLGPAPSAGNLPPLVVKTIVGFLMLEKYCIRGTLALAAGVLGDWDSKSDEDSTSDGDSDWDNNGKYKTRYCGTCTFCGKPVADYLGGEECESCFDEH